MHSRIRLRHRSNHSFNYWIRYILLISATVFLCCLKSFVARNHVPSVWESDIWSQAMCVPHPLPVCAGCPGGFCEPGKGGRKWQPLYSGCGSGRQVEIAERPRSVSAMLVIKPKSTSETYNWNKISIWNAGNLVVAVHVRELGMTLLIGSELKSDARPHSSNRDSAAYLNDWLRNKSKLNK